MKILGEFASLVKRTSESKQIDTLTIFDQSTDGYMVYRIGWENSKRIRLATMFVRIVNGKFWIEENRTEVEIAQGLMDAGVPKDDIRFGFHHPLLRDEPASAVA